MTLQPYEICTYGNICKNSKIYLGNECYICEGLNSSRSEIFECVILPEGFNNARSNQELS